MQPYAYPYLGYFRLLSETKLFVVLDNVQHIRRGYVHRNMLPDRRGKPTWMTLPLAPAPQTALISELHFAEDAVPRMVDIVARFPSIQKLPRDVYAKLMAVQGRFVPYAIRLLEVCCKHLGITANARLASEILPEPDLRGQDRILEICKRVGATRYLNAPGGRALYDEDAFRSAGIELEFLPPWRGPMESVLHIIAQQQRVAA